MKKSVFAKVLILGLIFALAGVLSCGGNDPKKIAPPSWIRGVWAVELDGVPTRVEFSSSDIIMNDSMSILALVKDGTITSYVQEVSDPVFSITIEFSDGSWSTEQFVKDGDSSMVSYVEGSNGEEEMREYTKTK